MKIVISRKGFDSSAGGCASPILPDGRMVSLPIPASGGVPYADISRDGVPLSAFGSALGGIAGSSLAHLDPDLDAGARPRLPGWLPAFGQTDAAQTHLAGQGVGVGDLFLFFGWFKETEQAGGGWRFRRGARDLHVLFGWLQVGEVVRLPDGPDEALRTRPWLAGHPHLSYGPDPRNAVYVASKELSLPGIDTHGVPGGGLFRTLRPELVLTADGQTKRSVWSVPTWMEPAGRQPLSHHDNPDRWTSDGIRCLLSTVGRGQEFVLDCEAYPEAVAWAASLIDGGRTSEPPVGPSPPRRSIRPSTTARTFRYVVAHDTGFAPCFDGGVCTLACCKPRVRKAASPGDWVLGFAPTSMGRARLLYAMRVGETMGFADYWSDMRFVGRRDNIYMPDGLGGYAWVRNGWDDHPEAGNHARDLSGANVLVADRWWRFPEGLDLIAAVGEEVAMRVWRPGRGHRVNGMEPGDLAAVVEALDARLEGGRPASRTTERAARCCR